MKKMIFITISMVFLLLNSGAFGQNSDGFKKYYFSTNTVSPLAAINPATDDFNSSFSSTIYKMITGIASNYEIGFNLNFGYRFNATHGMETRFSTGNADPIYYLTQIHLGYLYTIKNTKWYFGSSLKYWNLNNTLTKVHLHLFITYFSVGYKRPMFEKFFFDFRISQTVTINSFSSLPHSSSNGGFLFSHNPTLIGFCPNASISIGYSF